MGISSPPGAVFGHHQNRSKRNAFMLLPLLPSRNLRRQLIKVRQPILNDGFGRRAANLPGLLLGRVRHLLPSLELTLEFGRVEKGAALRWRRRRWSSAAAACHKATRARGLA